MHGFFINRLDFSTLHQTWISGLTGTDPNINLSVCGDLPPFRNAVVLWGRPLLRLLTNYSRNLKGGDIGFYVVDCNDPLLTADFSLFD